MLAVDLSRSVSSGHVNLLDINDQVLAMAPLEALLETDTLPSDYVASVIVPSVPFKVRIAAVDGLGRSTDTLWTVAFFPTALEARFVESQQSGSPGEVVSIPLRITNRVTSQTFRLSLTATPPTAVVAPSVLDVEVAASESRVVDLTVTLPSDLPLFSSVVVRANVVGRTDSAVTNQCLVEIEAAP
jgi:hypothetical protein